MKKLFNIHSLIVLLLSLNIVLTIAVIRFTNLHSVHPIFGNYKKFDSNYHKCQPWDACK